MSAIRLVVSTQSGGFAGLIRRRPLLSMYAIMFALAWSVMVPLALYSQGILAQPVPMLFELLTGWAPLIAAISVTAVLAGRGGVRRLLGRFLIWRVNPVYYGLALFLLAAIILGGIALFVASGGEKPLIPAAGEPLASVAFSFALLVVVGMLFNTEEIAWRGFALLRLQARFHPLAAGLLVAIPEALLHLPSFWIKENPFYQNVGLIWFSAFSVAAVFIYAFIFNRTGGSLLIVTMLHASQNAWANLLSDNSAGPFHFTVALMWIIALALILGTRGRLGYEVEPASVE